MKQEIAGTRLTLEPLRALGPDALDTHDIPGLKKATLTEIQFQGYNDDIGTTIRQSTNLFAGTNGGNTTIPANTAIIKAGLELEIAGAQRPHKLELRPPATILLEFPTDAPLVFPWLDKRHFRTLAALLLAIAIPLAPAFDDNDGDDDDPDTDRWSLSA